MVSRKIALRIIFSTSFNEHSPPFFQKANISPIQQLYKQKIAILAHNRYYSCGRKIDHDVCLTGAKIDLHVPSFLTDRGQGSPKYQTAKIWNSLPYTVRVVDRAGSF